MSDVHAWPGWSLLLIPVSGVEGRWDEGIERVRAVAESMNVAVGRGIEACEPCVRPGIEATSWIDPSEVLTFAFPDDIDIYEFLPLVDAGQSQVGEFFRAASEAALTAASEIAWISTEDWGARDRVRRGSGDVNEFVHFATSFGAWSTEFVGASANEIHWEGYEFVFCYFVHAS